MVTFETLQVYSHATVNLATLSLTEAYEAIKRVKNSKLIEIGFKILTGEDSG